MLIGQNIQHHGKKQMYRTRFIYYCMTLFLLQLHRPDEQPDTHMHLTCPWPPVALVTAVLRGISVSGTSSIDSIFSDITCKSAAVNFDANFPSLQPTVYNPSHSAMITTKNFLGSAGPRSTDSKCRTS
ncbi:hypothetical protein T09_420 [Trichinella sp. T9]|nr:hypothetical protein T09_420 [Trichinella sp. T9]